MSTERSPYDVFIDCALLGFFEAHGDLQQACYASGCSSWETFRDALDAAAYHGDLLTCEQGSYTLTSLGEETVQQLLTVEAQVRDGHLTVRQASIARSDLFGQGGTYASGTPLSEKLWKMFVSEDCEPLTEEEAEKVRSVVFLQEGIGDANPRQALLSRLDSISTR